MFEDTWVSGKLYGRPKKTRSYYWMPIWNGLTDTNIRIFHVYFTYPEVNIYDSSNGHPWSTLAQLQLWVSQPGNTKSPHVKGNSPANHSFFDCHVGQRVGGYFIHHTHSCWSCVPFSCLAKPFFEHPHVAFARFHVCWLRTTWTPMLVNTVNTHIFLGNPHVCGSTTTVTWVTNLFVT